MSYVIKNTNGNIVATVTDGTVDTSSTSLTLIGKNYKGIGEIYNENLLYLLENFANSTPPSNQIKGQVWFNSNTSKLNVYDGSNWRPVGSPFVSSGKPSNLVQGDFWIDTASQQLKFYDGANLITAGPIYTASQGKTGWIVEEITDTRGSGRIVASMYVSDIRMAILNPVSFTPQLPVTGFSTGLTALKAGLTFNSTVTDNNINAPSESSLTLIDPIDGNLDTSKFIRSDKSGNIDGTLTISDNDGITFGLNADFSMYVDTSGGAGSYKTILANQAVGTNLVIQNRTLSGFQDVLISNPNTRTLSVYPNDDWQTTANTAPTFNVNGNTTIQGTLTVNGATEFTNQTTLQITDKNIELAKVATPSNTTANGGGLTILGGAGGDKTFTWLSSGIVLQLNNLPTWYLNDNVKIPVANGYYVGNNEVLNSTGLGSSVVNSSLTSVGNLVNLTAAQFNFTDVDGLTVDSDYDFVINVDPTKIITLTNRVRINNVAEPSLDFDVANKDYVDRVKTSINYLTIDITGLATPNTDAVAQINALFPSITANINDIVRVLCLSYANGVSAPTVTRVVKIFKCTSVVGVRTWVYQTGQDIVVT